ncbi:methyltransferase FkbM family [Thioalkalivibrio sulfidiphilus HL-EbGr7]|uniref:Methyltransferase FkbM family n=1 Tax=Thioalkalivibrio sulfidiphilus (strain HL-EbGR7) TaxID=396588 RepID=B8GQX8_THISH|nr:FkbM family methyltransferase [Thioalkalivibrio sulfidiphilus]ACL72398.1 methyltransferase FkbM family [Thioalkalivibrio sulfidiphilus HL-EbGr7]
MSNENTKVLTIELLTPEGTPASQARFEIDDEKDLIQKYIASTCDFYERPLLDFVRSLLPRLDVFVDVGANIGNHSVFFGLACGAEIYAFEPNGPNYSRLERNFTLSNLIDRAHPRQLAFGIEPGYVVSSFKEGSTNTGGAGVKAANACTPEAVQLVRGDDQLAHLINAPPNRMVVKIDVEGMEIDVLKGMRCLIDTCRPVIICETSTDKNLVLMRNFLVERNYMVAACFFKTATFVLLPMERISEMLPQLAVASWRTARSYADYCRMARAIGHSRLAVAELNRWIG